MSLVLLEKHGLRAVRPEVIDSSMLKDFVDCESQFYLRHILGLKKRWRTKAEDGKFDWGTCWHKFQEILWTTHDLKLAIKYIAENFPASIDPTTDKHKRSKDRMLEQAFEYYDTKYPELNEEYEVLRAEQFFDIFDEAIGLRWAGRIDKIRRKKRNGKIIIWDYKTSSSMGPQYWNMHERGFQLPGYVWAGNRLFTEPIEEVCLDVMYTLSASHEFFRRTFRYTQPELTEWEDNVKRVLVRMNYMMDNYLHEPDKWVKNWNHCTNYGLCQFFDVHSITPTGNSRLSTLEDDYYEQRWDPILAIETETA